MGYGKSYRDTMFYVKVFLSQAGITSFWFMMENMGTIFFDLKRTLWVNAKYIWVKAIFFKDIENFRHLKS